MSLVKLINEATDDFLVSCDWEKNFEVCSNIKNDQDGQTFTTIVRKNIDKGSERTKARCIELLQIGMQNNYWIVRAVHTPDFQRYFVDILNKKILPTDYTNKLLNLIRAWGEAFRPGFDHPGFPNYFKTFQFLQQSYGFPARDDDSNYLPPQPPSRQQPNQIQPQTVINKTGNNQIDKILILIDEKFGQLDLLKEILAAIDPSNEDASQNDLVKELFSGCKEYSNEIRKIIERINDDSLVIRLLEFIDVFDDIQVRIASLKSAYQNRETLPPPNEQKPSSSFGGLESPVVLSFPGNVDYSTPPSYEKPFLNMPSTEESQTKTQGRLKTFVNYFFLQNLIFFYRSCKTKHE